MSNKLTAQDILKKFQELGDFSYEDFANDEWPEEFSEYVGESKVVDIWGGEGQGENIGYVYYFKEHDIYLRIDGYYQSHYGSYWDNPPYEVKPKEKIITVYE